MKRAFIVHGWASYPEHGWFPWLKQKLEQQGYIVTVPAMPHPLIPTIQAWVQALRKAVGEADDQTIFIGHSIGCQTIMRYLAAQPKKVKGAVFVAGWFELIGMQNILHRQGARQWIETPIDFKALRKVLPQSIAIFSDKDRYVSFPENKKIFVDKLHAEIVMDKGKKHFSGNQGIIKVPSVLKAIKKIEGKKP